MVFEILQYGSWLESFDILIKNPNNKSRYFNIIEWNIGLG